jgi:hypothetical protein
MMKCLASSGHATSFSVCDVVEHRKLKHTIVTKVYCHAKICVCLPMFTIPHFHAHGIQGLCFHFANRTVLA